MFAKIDENGVVIEWPIFEGQVEKDNPSFKFPLDVNEEYNFSTNGKTIPDGYVRVKIKPPYQGQEGENFKSYYYSCNELFPELIDGEYVQKYEYTPYSTETLEQNRQTLALSIRKERDILLVESDKKVFSDLWEKMSEVEKEQIANYRQALRDVPEQENFPLSVEWPLEPSSFIVKEI